MLGEFGICGNWHGHGKEWIPVSFVSLQFFVFLLLLLAVYLIAPDRHKWKVLLAFSIVFYASSGIDKLLFVLLTSLAVNFGAQRLMAVRGIYEQSCAKEGLTASDKASFLKAYKGRAKKVLFLTVAVCLAALFYSKYMVRVFGLISLFSGPLIAPGVIVPLGISYYTLSCIGYLADIYWRKIEAERCYPKFLLAMIYFPHIVEGPIARYDKLFRQFDGLRRPSYDRFCGGLQLMLWGYFKKLVVADRLVVFVDDVMGNIVENQGFTVLIALIFAAFQLYADFSGCMDIVCGVSEVFGIELEQNFKQPFFSKSVPEFWRRWHITLGGWFKDYVYYPLAVSPRMMAIGKWVRGKFGSSAQRILTTAIPLGFVWFFTGAWHGAGLYYLAWGFYYWILISGSTLFAGKLESLAQKCYIDTESAWWQAFRRMRTFFVFVGGQLITRAGGLRKIPLVARQIFSSFNIWVFWDQSLYQHGLDARNFMLSVLLILFLLWVDKKQLTGSMRERIGKLPLALRWTIYFAGIFAVLILGMYGPGYDAAQFVYEQY